MKSLATLFFAAFFTVTSSAQCYTVSSVPFFWAQPQPPYTQFSFGDDQWSVAKPLGFTFCFYGAQYDSVLIGTNGVITFDLDSAGGYCMWPIIGAIPSPATIRNSVMAPWNDLKFDTGNNRYAYFWTMGTAPYREFHVLWDSLPMYSCPTSYCSSQLVISETTNNISVYIETKNVCASWNQGKAIVGIQNQTGTSALSAPGRNAPGQWSATQEGWLFAPICNVCSGVGAEESQNTIAINVFPNPSSGEFTLQLDGTADANGSYEVVDVAGRSILSADLNGERLVHFSLETAGMYFVLLRDQHGMLLSTEKIIAE